MTLPIMRTPKGSQLNCKGWVQEAAYRMLLNNLDPDVAEAPDELVVYGGTGKACRNHESLNAILRILKTLGNSETLLIQSGKPVGVLPSHPDAPRVLLANSNLVGNWANWDHFHELEKKGLMMYGQMTAGSWIYIGSQGIVQGTYETFSACKTKYFNNSFKGKWIYSGGLGGMGGAQPLAATMSGACYLGVDVDGARIKKRLNSGYLDHQADSLQHALQLIDHALEKNQHISVGLIGNAATVLKELIAMERIPDIVTDQTSAHDELNGYVPENMSLSAAQELRTTNPEKYKQLSLHTMSVHVGAMIRCKELGSVVFDYGNNIRAGAAKGGLENPFAFQGFVPEFIRDLFCIGKGPFRWVALSGDPQDIHTIDEELLKLFPEDSMLTEWIYQAKEKIQFQGLPSRICWLGHGQRAKAGLLFNQLVKDKKVKAPIVIGRDHLDCGSVASPYRETEAMKDGSDAIADWPILNAMINSTNGASWVSFHHGGGVGMGYSLHAGMVIVADGTEEAALRLKRVLNSDPAMGVLRHADAGYPIAKDYAETNDINLGMN